MSTGPVGMSPLAVEAPGQESDRQQSEEAALLGGLILRHWDCLPKVDPLLSGGRAFTVPIHQEIYAVGTRLGAAASINQIVAELGVERFAPIGGAAQLSERLLDQDDVQIDESYLLDLARKMGRYHRRRQLGTTALEPGEVSLALDDLLWTFRTWLYLPDEEPLLAALAAVVANRADGDPVWLLIVGPPGGGKTELLHPLTGLPDVHAAATVTEPALLSGTPGKERAKEAKGGLLREIGDRGIILCKDFGSILSMHRDARAAVLAALREVYDGKWTRHVGAEGGRKLEWQGRVGFLAACTPTIDSHHSVMAALGERFLLVRLRDASTPAHARKALAHAGHESAMRRELAEVVGAFLAGVSTTGPAPDLSEEEQEALVQLSTVVCRCRSAVERDSYRREIELVPGAESPTRFAITLLRLFNALTAMGVDRDRGWGIVRRVGLDSMPAIRCTVLKALIGQGETRTSHLAVALGYPTTTTRRTLEDLAAYGIALRIRGGRGKEDRWRLDDGVNTLLGTFSEMSRGELSLSSYTNTVLDDKTETGYQPREPGAGPEDCEW